VSRLYAQFDPAALGAGLVLERSGTVLTYESSKTTDRTARALGGKIAGVGYAEFYLWGEAPIDDAVSVGLVTPDASLATYVGGDEYGIGYRVGEGQIHVDGASVASVDVGAKSVWIGVLCDVDALLASFYLGDVPLTTVSLPHDGPWHLAATVSGSAGYDLRCMLNAGQRRLASTRPGMPGWVAERESLGIARLATRGFITAPTDDPPNVVYRGSIAAGSRLSLRRRTHFWMWGSRTSSVQAASGDLRVGNKERDLDPFIMGDSRGALVRILDVPDGGTFAQATQLGVMSLDTASGDNDVMASLRFSDAIRELSVALQNRTFPPDAHESSRDQLWPFAAGAPRSVEAPMVSTDPITYALNDGPVLGLGAVRDKGDPLDHSADPPDYTLDAHGNLVLNEQAQGRVTVDFSTIGGDIPGGPEDLLDDDGLFTSGTNWTLTNAAVSAGRLVLTNSTPGIEPITAYARHTTFTMLAGKTYRIRLQIDFLSGGLPTFGQRPSILLTGSPNGTTPWPTRPQGFWSMASLGQFVAVISPTYDTALFIALVGTQAGVDIGRVKAVVINEINTDPIDDEALVPIKLEPFLRLVFERAGWPEETWSAADAAAIDAETGYAGINFYTRDAISCEAALPKVLDAYCASLWRDRDGVVRIARLRAPDLVDPEKYAGTITRKHMRGELRVRPDLAPGLSTQARGRENFSPLTDSDFVSDIEAEGGVPLTQRELLKASHRITCSYDGPLAGSYAFARYAPPVDFALDKRPDVQAGIDHAGGLYANQKRRFFEIPLPLNTDFRPDQVRVLIYDNYGLDKGLPVYIYDVDEDPLSRTATAHAWG